MMVSIVTPTFNRVSLLKECVKSILNQTYTDWELLLCDDGSEEDAIREIQAITQLDSRIRFLEKLVDERKGANAARNRGLQAANGEYIIFLDSDDLLHEDSLRDRIEVMDQNPQIDFAVFEGVMFEDGKALNAFNVYGNEPFDDLVSFTHFKTAWQTTGPTWRKGVIEKLGGWDESLSIRQDWALSVRAILHGCNYRAFPSMGKYYWRKTGKDRISLNHSSEQLYNSSIITLEKMYTNCCGWEKFDEYQPVLQAFLKRVCLKCPTQKQLMITIGLLINMKKHKQLSYGKLWFLIFVGQLSVIKQHTPILKRISLIRMLPAFVKNNLMS